MSSSGSEGESSSSESSSDALNTTVNPPKRRRLRWLSGGQQVPQHLLKCMTSQVSKDLASDDETCSNESDDEAEQHEEPINIESGSLHDGQPENQYDAHETSGSSSESVSSESTSSSSDSENSSSSLGSDTEQDAAGERMHMPELLYPGAKITKGEAVSKLLDTCCRHSASKALISDLVKYTCAILPRFNTFPKTMYFFEDAIQPYIPPDLSVVHYCCECCGSYLGSDNDHESECGVCQEEGEQTQIKYFYEFPLSSQLKYLFEERHLADAIDSYSDKAGDLSDITKGNEYLRVKAELPGKYDVVLLSGSDGLRPHNNSEQEIWTITYTICEVPPKLRKVFTMVSQIWYGKKMPPMNAFMVPFARSLKNVYQNGVQWTHPKDKVNYLSRGTGPVYTVDAPARGMIQNITQHGGFCSCNICEIVGEHIKFGKGGKTVYPYQEILILRTKETMKDQTYSVLHDGVLVKGVKGNSILNSIPLCDRSTALIYDYMHLFLLGTTRQFFSKWFGQKIKKKKGPNHPQVNNPWYIGHKSKEINAFLQSIKGTYEMTRFPKDVNRHKNYKASTWLVWLLYVSAIVLKRHLPEIYYQHWLMVVVAVHLILQEKISGNDLEVARLLLSLFVEEPEELYGKGMMTYNVHGLQHMALMVERWGALWSNSTFLFEDYNGVITRNLRGTVHISEEFVNVLGRHVANETLKNVLDVEADELSSNPSCKGREQYYTLSEEELALLQQYSPTAKARISTYGRVQRGKTVYTSTCYSAECATNNKTVLFLSDINTKVFGIVKFFCDIGGEILAFVKPFDVDNDQRFKHTKTNMFVRHIIPVQETQEICIVQFKNILSKVFKVGHYICVPPNTIERNL